MTSVAIAREIPPCPFPVQGPGRKLTSAERRQLREHCASGIYAWPQWVDRLRAEPIPLPLTRRWTPLIPHPEQVRMMFSKARFIVVVGGRRSGKSERVKRLALMRAWAPQKNARSRYLFAAPTDDQAHDLFWFDLLALTPPWMLARRPSRTEGTIWLKNGVELIVRGTKESRRLEGQPFDGVVLDEYAEMDPMVWQSTIRPMLSEMGRTGWAIFLGRPKGRNHFHKLGTEFAQAEEREDWDYFHWSSVDLMDPAEIESARDTSDALLFQQEYGAEFILRDGRAYYAFERDTHAVEPVTYDPTLPLSLCFDFNVEPGVCAYVQEQAYRGTNPKIGSQFTAVVGEVWVERNSNTEIVCRRIIADFGPGGRLAGEHGHRGEVRIYGDATGGARRTSGIEGADWQIVRNVLRATFGDRLTFCVRDANPLERDRVNAVNTRLRSAKGTVRLLVDPKRAPHVATDLENVSLIPGGSGEIDKPTSKKLSDLTHISDALGYYVFERFPADSHQGDEDQSGFAPLKFG